MFSNLWVECSNLRYCGRVITSPGRYVLVLISSECYIHFLNLDKTLIYSLVDNFQRQAWHPNSLFKLISVNKQSYRIWQSYLIIFQRQKMCAPFIVSRLHIYTFPCSFRRLNTLGTLSAIERIEFPNTRPITWLKELVFIHNPGAYIPAKMGARFRIVKTYPSISFVLSWFYNQCHKVWVKI